MGRGFVDALRRLASEAGKSKYSPAEIIETLHFLRNYKPQNCMKTEDVTEILSRLNAVCSKQGIQHKDLPAYIEDRVAEAKDLEERKKSLEQEILVLTERTRSLLQNAKTTEEEVARFAGMRKRLAAHGLSVDDDLTKLENMLASTKAANYDVSLMLDLASSCNSLSKKKKDIAPENQVMENKIQQNKGIIQQQALTITRNSIVLDELEELKRMGIAFPQMQSLRQVISEVAAARGLDPAKAMEQFLNDVGQNYDSVLGLAVKVQQRQNELAKAENELDILRIEYAEDRRAIESISVLHSKGVKNSEIISIKTLVESQDDGDIVKLESELAYCGSLQNATGEFEQEKKQLEKTLQTRTEIDLLESKKSALEAALRGAANDFVKEVSALKDVVNEVQVTARSALDTIDSTTCLTKAKIEEIGVVAHVSMERYKSSRDFLDLGSF